MPRTNLDRTNKLLSLILLAAGVIAAVGLVWLGQSGGANTVVFVAVAIVVTVAALYSNEFGLIAIIFVAAIDGFLKGFSPGWHTQLLKDYLIVICLVRWIWLTMMGHRRESVKLPIALPLVIFTAWAVVQFFNTRSESVLISLAGLRMWILWIPTFFLAHDALNTRRKIERMLLFMTCLMTPVAIYGIVQYYIGLDHLFSLGSGFDVYTYSYYAAAGDGLDEWRPPSTTVGPHAFASMLAMTILMGIGLLGYLKRNRLFQLLMLAAIPIMGVAMLLTAVRNAVASAVIGGIALLVAVRRVDLAVIAGIVGVIAVLQVDAITGGEAIGRIRSIVDKPQYTFNRIVTPWRTSVHFVMKHPLGGGTASGAGIGRIDVGRPGRASVPEHYIPWIENEYGRALVELGIPGFLFFIWMLYAVMRNNLSAYWSAIESRDRWLLAGIFGACFSMLAQLAVGSALYGPAGPFFWYYAAIAARLPRIEEQEMQQEQAASVEARATVLGAAQLPWMRGMERRK